MTKDYFVNGDENVISEWAKRKGKGEGKEEGKEEGNEEGKKGGYSLSFRPAGPASVSCLSNGAGAKPHSILEKTIKDSDKPNVQAAVNAFFDEFGDETVRELLKGMVGHWENMDNGADCKITGIYVTSLGKEKLGEPHYEFKIEQQGTAHYLRLDSVDEKNKLIKYYQSLDSDLKDYLFSRLFFSGDYDMHDFWDGANTVLSKKDKELYGELQTELYKARINQIREKYATVPKEKLEAALNEETTHKEDYYRVQHGPQYNYIVQMMNDNYKINSLDKLNPIVDVVANPSFPVAMIIYHPQGKNNGNWTIIENHDELENVYKAHEIELKESWRNPEEIEKYKIRVLIKALEYYGLKIGGATVAEYEEKLKNGKKACIYEQVKSMFKDWEQFDSELKKVIAQRFGVKS